MTFFFELKILCLSSMLDEFDAEAALARLLLPETPVLLDTTLEQLLHEVDVCPPQPADTQSNIQQEQTPQELHQC
jgi:hypothetical protein